MKHGFAEVTFKEAMQRIGQENILRWQMDACRWDNTRTGRAVDIHGFVSNGAMWHFYCLAHGGTICETEMQVSSRMPKLLGALNYLCAECAKNVP